MGAAIAGVTLLGMLVAGLRYPGALLAGTFLTYQARQLVGWDALGTAYTLAAIGLALWRYARAPHPLRVRPLDLAFAALLGVLFASVLWSVDPARSVAAALSLGAAAGGMYLIARVPPPPLRRLLTELSVTLAVAGPVLGLCMLGTRAVGGYAADNRLLIDGAAATAVGLAQPLPAVMLAAVVLVARGRSAWARAGAAASLGIMVWVAFVSATRGAFLAFIGGVALFLAAAWRRRDARALATAGGVLVAEVVAVLVLLPPATRAASLARLLGAFGAELDASTRERLLLFRAAWRMLKTHPIGGVGYGGFGALADRPYPHNAVLEVAASAGTLGLVAFAAYVAVLLATLLAIRRADRAGGAVLLAFAAVVLCQAQVSYAFAMLKPLFLVTAVAAAYARSRPISTSRWRR